MERILIGNTFPTSLFRSDAAVHVVSVDEVRSVLSGAEIHSFWGHANTLAAAEALLGASLKPKTERPALLLSPEGCPMLDGIVFSSCYICSPDYRPGFRPAIGEEVPADAIVGWQMLRIDWI